MPIIRNDTNDSLQSCLNLLVINKCEDIELPVQSSGKVALSEIIGFNFLKANDLTDAGIDGNIYGLLMRLQKRAVMGITAKLKSCLYENGVNINTMQDIPRDAAAYSPNIPYQAPANAIRKGITISRRNNCMGASTGLEALVIEKITIYSNSAQANIPL